MGPASDPQLRCGFYGVIVTPIEHVVGVDFSGAKLAGRTAWAAFCDVTDGGPRVRTLKPLGRFAGSDERADVMAWLVGAIAGSDRTLWAMDFPFALPFDTFGGWPQQLEHVAAWPGGAHEWGVDRLELADREHRRRQTDLDEKAPFDCYHYRIVYQTFHGMRDVLRPLAGDPHTAIVPLQAGRVAAARRFVVEACPSSTLKRLGLPYQNYKQPGGKPPDAKRRATRRAIFRGLAGRGSLSPHYRRLCMNDPGGDALDAVLAAVGGLDGWRRHDLDALHAHPRYPHEGLIFA